MNCSEFLERHSDYLDDHLEQDEAARWQEHLRQCTSCARYDRVVRRGTDMLRAQPEIPVPSDLVIRVQHTARIEEEPTAPDRWAGGAFALAIAATLAIIAWSPVLRTTLSMTSNDDGALATQRVAGQQLAEEFDAAEATEPTAPMAMEMSSWAPGYAAPSFAAATIPTRIRTAEVVSAGPYSPLVVEPPRYEPYPPPRRVVWGAASRPHK